MRILTLFLFAVLASGTLQAQTSGMYIFKRTVDFERDVTPEMKQRMGNMPARFEDEFELMFDAEKSLFRPSPVAEGMEGSGGMGGMMRRMGGLPEETYCDFGTRRTVSLHEVGPDMFVVDDSIAKQQWKLTNETKEIFGHPCRKALTTKTMQRRRMVVENGQQVRKEVTDTVNVEAWYAEDIACPSGPDFAGTLPGMIMEMTMADGRVKFEVVDYRKKYPKNELAPPKGTVITRDELKAKMEEYWKNFRPPGH